MPKVAAAKLLSETKAPRRPRGRPSAEDTIELNNRILNYAREEFFEHGLGHAKMSTVAKRARISTETLYARYKDKRELFEAVMQATIDAWAEGAAKNPAPKVTTLEEMLLHYVTVQIRALLSPEHMNMSILISAERKRYPDLGRMLLSKIPDRNKVIADHIRKFAEDEGIPCDDPEDAVDGLRAMVNGWVGTKISEGQPFGPKEQAKLAGRIVSLFLGGRRAW